MSGTSIFTAPNPPSFGGEVQIYEWIITADASDGSVPESPSDYEIHGWISRVDTIPAVSPAPTTYGVTLTDANGVDILGGNGANRSATSPGYILFNPPIRVDSVLTLAITGNTTNSAGIIVRVVEENDR